MRSLVASLAPPYSQWSLLVLFLGLTLLPRSVACGDEGMYPISELERLNLAQFGLKLTPEEIFSADQTCLVDGICRVNGCTGSFVSPRGLIITNHHCAYRAIQSASTTANDYLKDGFIPSEPGQEIPAAGYTVRVTESFSDVSDQVLAAVSPEMSFGDRTKAIDRRRKEIEQQAETDNPGMRAEVAEMFTGKTYVLFLYTYIRDVRLVFAPPSSIGNFGGDIDNWEWPRHTGDFSFMRAYVAPDGSSAEYSPNNVPYRPKRFLQVSPAGANEGDFVMLLGYPGRTARHQTASFLKYEQQFRLPYIVDLYQQQIDTMLAAGAEDRSIALKLSSRIKSLANVEKRSRGQLKGLNRAGIIARRSAEEAKLQAFIDGQPELRSRYGQVLANIDQTYAEMLETAAQEANFSNLPRASQLLGIALTVYESAVERAKPELERESAYMDRNFDQTLQRLKLTQADIDLGTDRQLLEQLIERFAQPAEVPGMPQGNDLEGWYQATRLTDPATLDQWLKLSADQLREVEDPFLKWAIALYPGTVELRELNEAREGRLSQLYGDLITVKQQFQQETFVPDANATLRLTHGTVRGYSPEDAVWMNPATTLSGVIAKTTGEDPFETPEEVVRLHQQGELGPYRHPQLNDVPVAMLYDTDTTGGNSGSPILNARGELVGVNFDRAFEATINDFAWNTDYSRSIGVDVRYVLWITERVYGARFLTEEMGLK